MNHCFQVIGHLNPTKSPWNCIKFHNIIHHILYSINIPWNSMENSTIKSHQITCFQYSSQVQGPLVFGFFIEQLGRGTLRPLADLGGRLLDERLRNNWRSSSSDLRPEKTTTKVAFNMEGVPGGYMIHGMIIGIIVINNRHTLQHGIRLQTCGFNGNIMEI